MSQFVQAAFNHSQEVINNLKTELSQATKALPEDASKKDIEVAAAQAAMLKDLQTSAVALRNAVGKHLLSLDN